MTGKKVFEELTRRFGFPEGLFRNWALVEHKEDVFVTTLEVAEFSRIRPVRKGIRLARIFAHGIKPTTNAMQVFGRHATRNFIELDDREAQAFVQGETVKLGEGRRGEEECVRTDGFVIVRQGGFTLGVGLLKNGLLKSQVPRSRRTGT